MHYPEIDPVAITLKIHWYAISYLVGIGLGWWVLTFRNKKYNLGWTNEQISDLVFYSVLGVILGGRIGYMLFYGTAQLAENPLSLFAVGQGGMSFHGGLIGVAIAFYLFGRKTKQHFFEVADLVLPVVPLGLGMGRLGNFANAELPGRLTDVPWGLIYPGETVLRHPSSLYQFALEGPVLFCILWFVASKPRPMMVVTGVFGAGYGMVRILSEFFREPDAHLQFIAFNSVTMGQLLSVPMVLIGLFMIFQGYRRQGKK